MTNPEKEKKKLPKSLLNLWEAYKKTNGYLEASDFVDIFSEFVDISREVVEFENSNQYPSRLSDLLFQLKMKIF